MFVLRILNETMIYNNTLIALCIVTIVNVRIVSADCSVEEIPSNTGYFSIFCNHVNIDGIVVDKPGYKTVSLDNCKTKKLEKFNGSSWSEVTTLILSCKLQNLTSHALDQLPSLKLLDLHDNRIETIPNDFFGHNSPIENLHLQGNLLASPTLDTLYGLNRLVVLDMSHNRITELVLGVLDQFTALNYLRLQHNKIKVLELGLLDQLEQLVSLDLSYNDLATIPLGLFDETVRINVLNLNGNGFSDLSLNAFDALKNLTYLGLGSCNLQRLPLGIFDQLVNLRELHLGDNNLSVVPLGVLDRTINLKRLDLSGNNFNVVPLGTFDELRNLRFLSLSDCNMTGVSLGLLDELEMLTGLDLSRNEIDTIPLGLFDKSKNIITLDLSSNNFTTIPPGTLDALHNLKYLNLDNCQLRSLHPTVLDRNVNIVSVRLSGNKIHHIPNDSFKWKSLLILDLSRNKLRTAPDLERTIKLTKLNLDRNKIGKLPTMNTENLETFRMANNVVRRIDEGFFNESVDLRSLDLSDNFLHQLSMDLQLVDGLDALDLSGNSFTVTAFLYNVSAGIKTLNVNNCELKTIPALVFTKFTQLEDLGSSQNHLQQLDRSEMSRLNRLRYLNVSHNLLTHLPRFLFNDCALITIDLSYNAFKTFPMDLLGLKTLECLYLRGNEIQVLDVDVLVESESILEFIDLRNNRLVFIEDLFFTRVPYLNRLEIVGNPWDCKCLDALLMKLSGDFIEFTAEDYFNGTHPVCVRGANNTCTYSRNDLDSYLFSFYLMNLNYRA